MRVTTGLEFDNKELLAFGNRVFGEELPEGGFAELLPKLDSGAVDRENYKVVAEEDGQIAAMVLSLPLTLMVFGQALKARYIGLVCVAEEARGRGYMKLLMEKAVDDMKDDGVDLSILGGQRQRYGYFGYEPAGFEVHQTLTVTNGRHALKDVDCSESGILTELLPMKSDSESIQSAYELYCTSAEDYGAVRRPGDFYNDLCSWTDVPYEIRQNGRFAGYLCADGRTKGDVLGIGEIVLEKHAQIPEVLKACLEYFREKGYQSLRFVLPAFDRLNRELGKICESIEICCNHSFLVLDYVRVLSAAMSWKAAKQGLVDGKAVLVIDGKRIAVTVDNGIPAVREEGTETAGEVRKERIEQGRQEEEPAVILTGNEAVRLLFSPAGGLMQVHMGEKESGKALPAGWFPIELYLSGMDAC